MHNTKTNWCKSASNLAIDLHWGAQMNQPPILVIGGVHGDEPEGVWLAQQLLKWLSENNTKVPWYLITCLNPDGFTKKTRVNSNGVDLNRNFPCQSWSPDYTKDRYFPGHAPGTEPEVIGLVNLIDEIKPQLVIHLHSWEPMIVYTGDPGRRDSERLGKSSGYLVKPEIGYPTHGSLGEYGWRERGIPVICVEEQEHEPQENIWPHFKNGFIEIFSDGTLRRAQK